MDENGLNANSVQYVPPGKMLSYLTGLLIKETPEEHVRQRMLRALVEEYAYDKSQLRVNYKINVGRKTLPVDIAIFPDNASHLQENIYIIIETKRPEIKLNDKDNGIEQLKSYVASCINCQFGFWTNGEIRECFQKNEMKTHGVHRYQFSQVVDLPQKGKSVDEYEKPDFSQLRPAIELKSVFKRINDYIYNLLINKDVFEAISSCGIKTFNGTPGIRSTIKIKRGLTWNCL